MWWLLSHNTEFFGPNNLSFCTPGEVCENAFYPCRQFRLTSGVHRRMTPKFLLECAMVESCSFCVPHISQG